MTSVSSGQGRVAACSIASKCSMIESVSMAPTEDRLVGMSQRADQGRDHGMPCLAATGWGEPARIAMGFECYRDCVLGYLRLMGRLGLGGPCIAL